MEDSSRFFSNRSCEHFPCHEGVPPERFNCLFCYCPLYALGSACGGDFSYNERGRKDCSACTALHDGDGGAARVARRFPELARLAARANGTHGPRGAERDGDDRGARP